MFVGHWPTHWASACLLGIDLLVLIFPLYIGGRCGVNCWTISIIRWYSIGHVMYMYGDSFLYFESLMSHGGSGSWLKFDRTPSSVGLYRGGLVASMEEAVRAVSCRVGLCNEDESRQVSTLLYCLGEGAEVLLPLLKR